MRTMGCVLSGFVFIAQSATAENWVVRGHNPGQSSQCAVALASDGAVAMSFPSKLVEKPTRKAACEHAVAHKSADLGADGKSCAEYTALSVAECAKDKIKL